jgi:hypothetical protein
MKWITWEKVKVDRVSCPWLMKKFADPPAQFFFVPAPGLFVEIVCAAMRIRQANGQT